MSVRTLMGLLSNLPILDKEFASDISCLRVGNYG